MNKGIRWTLESHNINRKASDDSKDKVKKSNHKPTHEIRQ